MMSCGGRDQRHESGKDECVSNHARVLATGSYRMPPCLGDTAARAGDARRRFTGVVDSAACSADKLPTPSTRGWCSIYSWIAIASGLVVFNSPLFVFPALLSERGLPDVPWGKVGLFFAIQTSAATAQARFTSDAAGAQTALEQYEHQRETR